MKRVSSSGRAGLAWILAIASGLFAASTVRAAATDTLPSNEPVSDFRATFDSTEQRLDVSAGPLSSGLYEVRFEIDGLTNVETGAAVNEPGIIYLPPSGGVDSNPPDTLGVENVFFFNQLAAAPGWELVAQFDTLAQGTWKLNGRFSPLGGSITREIVIPVKDLEAGENLLHIRSDRARVPTMIFRLRQTVNDGTLKTSLTIPHGGWSGRVQLLKRSTSADGAVLAEQVVAMPAATRRMKEIPARWWEDRTALDEAAVAVGRSLLRSQIKQPGSLFENGFHLVYDPTHHSHRMSHWIWSWGPSIDLLLRLSKTEAAERDGLATKFRAAAIAAGERSLGFGVTKTGHPALGVSTVRWEPSRATPLGWAEYISTADSLFLAGWGWMSLYRETGRDVYLERTKTLVAAAQRLMAEYPVVPQDWIVERDTWTPHTLDESVFGMIGFRRLYEATESRDVAAAGRRFLDSHLKHMGRESGLLARAWLREEDKEIWDPDIKGHAWVIEGYLDAHRLSGDARYLQLADQLAQRVMECQADDGSWTYLFRKPVIGDAIDDKGTAIWAYLFYDLYKSTKNPAHLAAGRRALGWCLRQQYRGDDPNLDGAILHPNSMAYVRRRPMSILYTTTFFGHALLEELALRKTPVGTR